MKETISSLDIAKKICELENWKITNQQIHKILYLIQLVHVSRTGHSLIKEPFEAWYYGPVIPSLHNKIKCFGDKPIQDIFFAAKELEPEIEKLVIEVFGFLKNKTLAELVAITHRKRGAWHKTWRNNPLVKNEIKTSDILKEARLFKTSKPKLDA